MLQYGDIVGSAHDSIREEWRFDIILDSTTFYSIPNWLDLEGCRLPVIVTGRKSACWHYDEIGHLFMVCLGKKTPQKIPDRMQNNQPTGLVNGKMEVPIVLPAGKVLSPGMVREKKIFLHSFSVS